MTKNTTKEEVISLDKVNPINQTNSTNMNSSSNDGFVKAIAIICATILLIVVLFCCCCIGLTAISGISSTSSTYDDPYYNDFRFDD